jgi:hypothetical protein
MKRLLFVPVLLGIALSSACTASKPAADAAQAPAAPPAPPPPPPKSEYDKLRDAAKDFVTRMSDCDRRWFADVQPDRIDKWDLPVDIKAMEAECDRVLGLYETLLDQGAFRSAAMDGFLRLAATASDRYLVLGYRCKKVGVRDKIPYKAEVAAIRDALRADVARLNEAIAPVLALTDADLRTNQQASPESLPALADPVLARVRTDMKDWIEQSLKDKKPTWRYSLRTSEVLARRAASALKSRGGAGAQDMAAAADALAAAWAEAVKFYTGAYFDTEEKEGPKIRRAVATADVAYRNAARKVVKPAK